MNCSEFHNRLQQRWDGEPDTDQSEMDRHLAVCSSCRELQSAARQLADLLRAQVVPLPPDGLTDRIVYGILEDLMAQRRVRQRWGRRVLVTAALAAGVLLAVVLGYAFRPAAPAPESPGSDILVSEDKHPSLAPAHASLNIEEAGTALVALVNRTAEETVGQGRVLLPQGVPAPTLPGKEAWAPTLDPGSQSLQDVQQGVAIGFEPVTSSARRAVNLFLREIPPMEVEK